MITGHPGDYEIRRFLIHGPGNREVDIAGLVPEIHITESILNDSIRGYADVIDKTSLLESFPLRGEERITIEVKDAEDNPHVYDLFLYKIDNVNIAPANDGLSYKIHFCSFGRFVAGLNRVCTSYNDYVHNIVEDVFNRYWKPEEQGFELNVLDYGQLKMLSQTSLMQSIVIPNMTPMQTMDFLSRRSFSDESKSSSFRFFENIRGFHFASDEDLYRATTDPNVFTFSDMISNSSSSFFELRHNFLDFQNSRRVNTIDDINSGAYRHHVIEIDLVSRIVNTNVYDYTEAKQNYNIGLMDGHIDEFIEGTFTDNSARQFMVFNTNTSPVPGSLSPDNRLVDMISNRLAYRYHSRKIITTAQCYGRFDMAAGDVIAVEFPEAIVDSNPKMNPQISGKYLIVEITRSMVRETYTDTLYLMKADWEEKRDYGQGVLI